METRPIDILQKYWGYSEFRPLQEPIIHSVLEGNDTLALMPTGGGKSICFQVPALCKEGICLVISPLIALMKDQVENLQKRKIKAAAIFSGMPYRDIDRTLDNAAHGHLKFLYLSPERLNSELVQERIKRMNVNLIAVDEAHCISQWGYDFRPAYHDIVKLRELVPDTPIIAVTATATKEVVEDIQQKLEFKKGQVFEKSFARDNLAYAVLAEENKEAKLLDILRRVQGSAVIYVRNRRKTKDLAQLLLRSRIRADFYHAGLDPDQRTSRQEDWIKGKTRVVVSTNAFGMGIDKADVRLVVHMGLPDSLEAYFQEAGRAGRDGKKAYAVLLYNQSDRLNLEKNYERSFPALAEIRQVYRALGSYFQLAIGAGAGGAFDFDLIEFCQNFQLSPVTVHNSLKILEQSEWLVMTDAIFIPSSLKILVSKDELYDYQLRHPKMDLIIKTILRTYQGAFQHFINIREKQLANFLKMPVGELRKSLELLQQEGIINYQPQKDKPQIIFCKERVDAENLSLDHRLYEFRKKGHLARIQAAIAYAENPICRSQQLLRYFGQSDAEICGICDVCTGRTKSDVDQDTFEVYKTKIRKLLTKEHLQLEELVKSFHPKREHQVLKTIEYLEDEGFIIKQNDRFLWKEVEA
ncbi:MAG: ATP-dependent DNA helicase RecQ [Saprospiraceae bacterium]|nr:MAG: ATP-dependent DNA helicase RecQ [Saprospiraceae bacterium]